MPRATADRPLTARQTRFAANVVAGKTKAQAFREEYKHDPSPKRAMANRRTAAQIAAAPHVAAEIRRLTWLSCPPVADLAGMREHSVRVLSDLSRSDPSGEVRLKAALALYRIAETSRAAAAPQASDTEQDRLLASLRKLYIEVGGTAEKASDPLGPEPGPLVPYDDEPIDIDAIAQPAGAQEPDGPAADIPLSAPAEEPDEAELDDPDADLDEHDGDDEPADDESD